MLQSSQPLLPERQTRHRSPPTSYPSTSLPRPPPPPTHAATSHHAHATIMSNSPLRPLHHPPLSRPPSGAPPLQPQLTGDRKPPSSSASSSQAALNQAGRADQVLYRFYLKTVAVLVEGRLTHYANVSAEKKDRWVGPSITSQAPADQSAVQPSLAGDRSVQERSSNIPLHLILPILCASGTPVPGLRHL